MRTERRSSVTPFLIGAGLGATVMCLLDPSTGRRRRALLQDKSRHLASAAATGAGKATRDARNRLTGASHRAASLLGRAEDVTDEVLAERVRSKLGRVVPQPHAIDVDVRDGIARLSGPVAGYEVHRVLRSTGRIRGVRGVENFLELRPGTGGADELDGTRGALRDWRGAAAMAVGATGAALLARGLTQRASGVNRTAFQGRGSGTFDAP